MAASGSFLGLALLVLCVCFCLLYETVGAQSCQAQLWSSLIPLGSKGCSKGCFMIVPHPGALCVCALCECLSTSAGSLPLDYRVEETVSKLFTFSHGMEPKPCFLPGGFSLPTGDLALHSSIVKREWVPRFFSLLPKFWWGGQQGSSCPCLL